MRGRAAYLTVFALAATSGCVDRVMTINSDPDGAIVYLNDQEIGRTPIARDFQQYGDYELEVRKDGYETIKSHQETQEPWWQLVPLDLVTELLPFRFHDVRNYHYLMAPSSTQPADAKLMLTRAEQYRALLRSSPNTRLPVAPTSEPVIPPHRQRVPTTTTAPTTMPSTLPSNL